MPKQILKRRMKEAIFPQSRHKRAILLSFNCQNNGSIKMFHLVVLHHCLTHTKWHLSCKMIWTISAFYSLKSQLLNSVAKLNVLNTSNSLLVGNTDKMPVHNTHPRIGCKLVVAFLQCRHNAWVAVAVETEVLRLQFG